MTSKSFATFWQSSSLTEERFDYNFPPKENYANASTRLAIRLTNVAQAIRLHFDRRHHARARHRRKYGAVQCAQYLSVSRPAVPATGAIGSGLSHLGSFAKLAAFGGELPGLSRAEQCLREHGSDQ